MSKKIYTGFEAYWANGSADVSIPVVLGVNSNLYAPAAINIPSAGIKSFEFNTTARSLTPGPAGNRGTFIRINQAGGEFFRLILSQFTNGIAGSYYIRTDRVNGDNTATSRLIASGRFQCEYVHSLITPTIQIRDSANTIVASAILPVPLANGTWYRLRFKASDTVGFFELDGTSCTAAADFFDPTDQFSLNTFAGAIGAFNFNTDIDDMCLNDLDGAVDNDTPPGAAFFSATIQGTDGANAGWTCSPAGPTPPAALRDGVAATTVSTIGAGHTVGINLTDYATLFPGADRVLSLGFNMKDLVKLVLTAPGLQTRLTDGVTDTDTPLGPPLAPGNFWVPTYYKVGTTEFTKAEYDALQAQLNTF